MRIQSVNLALSPITVFVNVKLTNRRVLERDRD